MDTKSFRINTVSFYGYGTPELTGTITLTHEYKHNEIKMQLNAADCSKIVNIIADRLAETIHEAARQFWIDVGMPMREFMPVEATSTLTEEQKQKLIDKATDNERAHEAVPPIIPDDEIPY